MTRGLLDIGLIDFNDPYDIGGFVALIVQTGAALGMTMPDFRPSRESNEIRQLANRLVRKLDGLIPAMPSGNALLLVSAYDLAHRLAYLEPADRRFINRTVLRAFDARIAGDNTVDEYALFHEIRRAVSRRDAEFLDKPLLWSCLREEQWHKEACDGFDRERLSEYDIINRVTILLECDLFAYEGRRQERFKKRLFDSHRHYLENYGTADRRMPYAVNDFFMASCEYLTDREFTACRQHLDELRLSNPATNRFLRAALSIAPPHTVTPLT
ncbi:MAG: hypothetical protein K2L46_08590 [Paramuribaculum sp.]|nr:hypothetical protein [Paramuribaculum sp.]